MRSICSQHQVPCRRCLAVVERERDAARERAEKAEAAANIALLDKEHADVLISFEQKERRRAEGSALRAENERLKADRDLYMHAHTDACVDGARVDAEVERLKAELDQANAVIAALSRQRLETAAEEVLRDLRAEVERLRDMGANDANRADELEAYAVSLYRAAGACFGRGMGFGPEGIPDVRRILDAAPESVKAAAEVDE